MIICPSLLTVEEEKYKESIIELKNNHIDHIHIDIMDKDFVPNTGVDPKLIKIVKEVDDMLYADTHLMVRNVYPYIDKCIEYNTNSIIIHIEILSAENTLDNYINYIKNKDKNIDIGLAINPGTNIDDIYKYLSKIDKVLIMSVEPGKGGQQFITNTLEKIKRLNEYMKNNMITNVEIEVDGGVNSDNVKLIKNAGATSIVVGNYIFSGDIEERINKIRIN